MAIKEEDLKFWKKKAQKMENYLQALHYCVTTITNALVFKPDSLLSIIIDLACIYTDAQKGSLMIADKKTSQWFVAASRGLTTPQEKYKFGEGLIGEAEASKKILFIEDESRHLEIAGKPRPKYLTNSFIIVPLTIGEEVIAILNLGEKQKGGRFSNEDMGFLSFFAGPAAVAIKNFYLMEAQLRQTTSLEAKTEDLDKTRNALMNILEDVEEERNTAQEEKEKTNTIIVNLADGLLAIGQDDKISLVNPLAEKFLGIKKEQIAGKSIAELAGFSIFQRLNLLLADQVKEVFRKELAVGKDLVLEVSFLPIIKEKEKMGSMVILHDVTREKRIEKMKTEFVSLAAHQLRTPLSAIKWTVQMILEGDLGELNEEQRSFLEKAYISNERMISLINDLLNVARIEEGKYIYHQIITDIEPVLAEEVNSFKDESEKRKVKLQFKKISNKLPKVNVEVEKIRLAIHNLIDNAVKYTNAGGSVIVSVKSSKGQVEVSVKDTGVGIPKDEQERIFGKFFRSDKVVRMETVGSGLGLFIVKNIIEGHNGKVWFESEEGKGTTFYFSLPVAGELAEIPQNL